MNNSEVFKTILSAIIGGISVYYIPKLIRAIISQRRPLLVYQFDDDGSNQAFRRVHHSFGEMVEDKDASNGKAWEHTAQRLRDGHTTCYGPYTKEIPFRGKYKARFRIKAERIKQMDIPLVILDVTHGERQPDGKIVLLGLPLVEKKIKGKKLLDGRYKEFDVYFEYDGQSLIEFRCAVENPVNYKQNVERILFDNVQIFHAMEMI